MADFTIDPQSISWTEIVRQLKAFLQSKPDATAWKDFYDCGAGTTLIELIAGYATFSKRDLVANRRETYLNYAKNLSSVIGIVSNTGYSAYRGSNSHIRLKVIANVTKTVSKYEIIGSVKNIDLIALNNYTLINGQTITIDCIVGNLNESVLVAKDSSLQVFRFLNDNVSEDFRLKVNNTEVPTSIDAIELLNDKYITITNAFGGLDAYYLNEGDYKYIALTDIILEYVELFNLNYNFPDDIKFMYGFIQAIPINVTSTDTQILNVFIEPESIDSIKINAPLRAETQRTLRSREDFKKVLKLLNPEFIDTNGKDISPALVELTYLKNNLTKLTTNEKTNYINQLNDYTLYGTNYQDLSDPIQVNYSLKISIKQLPDIDLTGINNDILEIFAYVHEKNKPINSDNRVEKREKSFEHKLDLEYLENEFNRLPQVKISRIELNVKNYLTNTFFKRGDFIKPFPDNGFIYECMKQGVTGLSTPTWVTEENEMLLENIPSWNSGTNYSLNTIITPNPFNNRAYKCIQSGTSDIGQPFWNIELGSVNIDGTVKWECIDILSVNTVIWKCLKPDVRTLSTEWNNYIILDYGSGIIWL